jgi:hypothetical protein
VQQSVKDMLPFGAGFAGIFCSISFTRNEEQQEMPWPEWSKMGV